MTFRDDSHGAFGRLSERQLVCDLRASLVSPYGHQRYEELRAHLIETRGYDRFRDLQREAFEKLVTA